MDNEWIHKPSEKSSRKTEEIIVIGGGGHARVVISILKKLKTYRVRGYTDPRNCGELLGVPYLGTDNELADLTSESQGKNAVLAVGQIGLGKARHEIYHRLRSLKLVFPKIISPDAIVNDGVSIGEGAVVMDGTIINTGAELGAGVIANTRCIIEHDVTLADWVHIAPGATISGGVNVGRFSMIGAGATVIEGKNIPAETIIGAGATVVHDLVEPGIYVGTPARRLK
jgi:sugar O-acyltransferase (sialic acid O-acetyltransferase NeuD family)